MSQVLNSDGSFSKKEINNAGFLEMNQQELENLKKNVKPHKPSSFKS